MGRKSLVSALTARVDRVAAGQRVTAFVAGEAGIGKTSLLRAVAAHADARGVLTAWGTCLDVDGAPAFWPWTQALEILLGTVGDAPGLGDVEGDGTLVATIVPSIRTPHDAVPAGATERERFLAIDATRRMMETIAARRPVLVILDDLQWADPSTLALLDLASRSPTSVGLGLIGAYRDTEFPTAARQRLAAHASSTEHFHLEGLPVDDVRVLLEQVTGAPVEAGVAAAAHRRTGGHPFFVRELALLGDITGVGGDRVPVAIRDAIEGRLRRLPDATLAALEAAALVGLTLLPDVVAAALGRSAMDVEDAVRPAIDAGILATGDGETRFAHDLLRETLQHRIDPVRRVELHRTIATALEERLRRGGPVTPSALARHHLAALPVEGPDRAMRWALAAAAADRASLAFAEAAGHLRRLRRAVALHAVPVAEAQMVEILLAEADALARAGTTVEARGLLRRAADLAERTGEPGDTARAALATAHLGARFAVRRNEIVRQLEHAREVIAGEDDALEARVTATLARELQHSVADDRPRAAALSERALELGRRAGERSTLLDCLLGRHDVLWQPGAAEARADVAREIIQVAIAAGDDDRHAEGLLLLANALLEQGSPAFESSLEACLSILDTRNEPRHRYTVLTRRACVALLRGDLDDAERLLEDAKALGDRILEPDAGNVHMSQRLELVRARDDPGELSAFASAAVAHWTGAPIHANAVAAGFLARAGDLEVAERHVAVVVDLGTWRADRSYLWSVFVRELAVAAVALDNRALCQELLEDLRPLVGSCGVNGAVVAFAGCHAYPAALVADAVGEPEMAALFRDRAELVHRRLGAGSWDTGSARRVTATGGRPASMRREGAVWRLAFDGREATVAHSKGLGDIARLLAAPGTEIHVLDLFDAPLRAGAAGELADRHAINAYRDRLLDVDAELDDAERDNDEERRVRAEIERQALVDEIVRVTGTGGRRRPFANHPAERARKAVTARVRDTIRKLEPVLPELAAHLEQGIVTGGYCRYRPGTVDWHIEAGRRR